jgi:hypothetical protein
MLLYGLKGDNYCRIEGGRKRADDGQGDGKNDVAKPVDAIHLQWAQSREGRLLRNVHHQLQEMVMSCNWLLRCS